MSPDFSGRAIGLAGAPFGPAASVDNPNVMFGDVHVNAVARLVTSSLKPSASASHTITRHAVATTHTVGVEVLKRLPTERPGLSAAATGQAVASNATSCGAVRMRS